MQLLVSFMIKNQNKRISPLLPKRSPILIPIERPPNKLLERLRASNPPQNTLRKTISVELSKTKETKLEDIINQKLVVRELAT